MRSDSSVSFIEPFVFPFFERFAKGVAPQVRAELRVFGQPHFHGERVRLGGKWSLTPRRNLNFCTVILQESRVVWQGVFRLFSSVCLVGKCLLGGGLPREGVRQIVLILAVLRMGVMGRVLWVVPYRGGVLTHSRARCSESSLDGDSNALRTDSCQAGRSKPIKLSEQISRTKE